MPVYDFHKCSNCGRVIWWRYAVATYVHVWTGSVWCTIGNGTDRAMP